MEAYNLPVKLREWFVQRLVRQMKEEEEQMQEATKGKKSAGRSQTLGAGNNPAQMPQTTTR